MSRAIEPLFDRIHLVTNNTCDRYFPGINFKPDGWPLCSNCGQDELYSLSTPPTAETIRGCYLCGPISPTALVDLPTENYTHADVLGEGPNVSHVGPTVDARKALGFLIVYGSILLADLLLVECGWLIWKYVHAWWVG